MLVHQRNRDRAVRAAAQVREGQVALGAYRIAIVVAEACAERATPGLVARLREIRRHIEAAFAAGDVPRVLDHTELFYDAMFDGAGKLVSLGVVKSLNARINRLRALTIATPGRSQESNREMNALLDAIERGDGNAAAAASCAHIERTAELALQVLAAQGEQATATE